MSFILRPIDTVETISPADFTANYLKPRRPLVIKGPTIGPRVKNGHPNI
jgi:hypothetical protein